MFGHFNFIVVGGGIAGVSCVETLACLDQSLSILLVTCDDVVKVTTNHFKLSRYISFFDVTEKESSYLALQYSNVTICKEYVKFIDNDKHMLYSEDKVELGSYDRLCLCTGSSPSNRLFQEKSDKDESLRTKILTLRDTHSVINLVTKLKGAKRLCVVGNGGIAMDIVPKLIKTFQIVWIIKDPNIACNYIDEAASKFLLKSLAKSRKEQQYHSQESYLIKDLSLKSVQRTKSDLPGCGVGPGWHEMIGDLFCQSNCKDGNLSSNLQVLYNTSVIDIFQECEKMVKDRKFYPLNDSNDKKWPIFLEINKENQLIGCDFVINATGVIPNSRQILFISKDTSFNFGRDEGILVDYTMKTSILGVFAAGDVCCCEWEQKPRLWFQMRLWSQARQMGISAGEHMFYEFKKATSKIDSPPFMPSFFDLFCHTTEFFTFKIILLGLFNAQHTLEEGECTLIVRAENDEYIKLILVEGKVVGAILIGDTDFEETVENLILNELDISCYGSDILNPNIDVSDYFD